MSSSSPETSMKKITPPKKSSKYVIDVINDFFYVLYNAKRKILEIRVSSCKAPDLAKTITSLRATFPEFAFWINIPLESDSFMECVQVYTDLGFGRPYIADVSPFGEKIPHSISISQTNTPYQSFERSILNIMYVLEQYKTDGCSIHVKFSKKAVDILKQTCKEGHTKNKNNSVSQKELGGSLRVVNIRKNEGRIVYIIGLKKEDISPGSEEEVNISSSRYNFHSHPEEAYTRHNVKVAWPSVTDYLGYLKLGTTTIFHCVATLEGLYVMSFGKYWVNNLKKVSKSFIKKEYEISRDDGLDSFKYVNKVNNILYKGHPIYVVKFLPWDTAVHTIFSIDYARSYLTCVPLDLPVI